MIKKTTVYIVDSLYHNYRIDLFLSLVMSISRTESLSLLDQKLIFINNECHIKKSKKVFLDDIIEIINKDTTVAKKETAIIPITILYIHEDFLIINKPPFISCHKTNAKDTHYTIADFARSYWNDTSDLEHRYGIVHRLDKETTGVLIIARNNTIKNILLDLFKKRKIEKKYIAFIEKGLGKKSGNIEYAIMRDPLCPVKMTYSFGQGKAAETKYTIIEEKKNFDIAECFPKTGRTHQIRVHFQALGYPLIGDKIYGKESKLITRQALHAHQISFTLKDTKYTFKAPLWPDMEELQNN